MVQCYNRADKEAASMDGLTHEKLLQIERNNPKETQLEKDMRVPVRKSNQLIQRNRVDMTVREQRLLLYCISRIKPTDKGGELYTVHIRDVCRASGIEGDIDGEAYGAVHEAVKKLDSYNFELNQIKSSPSPRRPATTIPPSLVSSAFSPPVPYVATQSHQTFQLAFIKERTSASV